MSGSLKEVGIIIGEASSSEFLFSSKPSDMPSRWEYLMTYSEEEVEGQLKQVRVVAQVERVMSASQALTKELDIAIIKKIIESGLADSRVWGKAKILGFLTGNGELQLPKKAVTPGKPVYVAPTSLLEEFYSYPREESIEVGSLITRSDVPIALSVKGFRRHLALIAQTGSGKTYLAGILADEILAKGGTVIMLDPHADYVFLSKDAAGKRHELSDRMTVFRNPASTGRYSLDEVGKVSPYEICFSDLDIDEMCLISGIDERFVKIKDGLEKAIEQVNTMGKTIPFIFFVIVFFALSGNVLSADLDVCPTCSYTAIQAAIDAAKDGDRIRIAQGNYNENLIISNSFPTGIIISGGWSSDFGTVVNDPTHTVVDAGNNDRAFFISGAPSNITIENVTLQRGKIANFGGCMAVNHPSGMIHLNLQDVIVQDCNSEDSFGGGISFLLINSQLSANLVNVTVRRNHADVAGGGISIISHADGANAEVRIVNSIIYSNTAEREGGGLQVWAELGGKTDVLIINSTITGSTSHNQIHGGGGIAVVDTDEESTNILKIYNTILFGNTATPGGDVTIDLSGTKSRADIFYDNVNGIDHMRGTFNQGNNLNTDPLFLNPGGDDFRLGPDSPLINSGTLSVPSPPGLPSTDFEGKPRALGGAPDIGAYETEGAQVTPGEGTVGTEIIIAGSGFGAKKGKILIHDVSATVLKWMDGFIYCRLTKPLSPGSYDITIQPKEPKGAPAIVYQDGFTVKAPGIDSVEPSSGPAGDEITIEGSFFGTKKGKLTLGGKSCKVVSWTMVPTTGASEIRFVVPKSLDPGTYDLIVTTTKVGSDTVNFTVE